VHVDLIPQAAVTACRLRADRQVLRQRFTGRGGPAALVDGVLREADALNASTFADACVDTSGLLVNEVARRVGERTGGWPASALGRSADAPELTLCRLHAGRQHLTERIMSRGQGGSWAQPGDPLRGQPVTRLLHVADQAVASAAGPEHAGIGDLRIDTDGHTVEQVADAITADAVLSEL
jgi:hypothetical protein